MKPIHWETLYRNNAPRLKGLCRRYVGDAAIADDLVQETFVTAIEKADTFRNSGAIEGWIRKIAINKALQYLREQHHSFSLDEVVYQPEKETVMEHSRNKIRAAIEQASFSADELLTVIDHLPVHHKMVFNLYVMEGYGHQQIAEMLSISPGTSKSHLSRARKKAQELLYTKTQEQRPIVQHRKFAWLLLWLRPGRPIDAIFKRGLKNLELATSMQVFVQSAAPLKAISWIAGIAGKTLIFSSTTAIIAGSIWLATTKDLNEPLQTIPQQTHDVAFVSDSIQSIRADSLKIVSIEPINEQQSNTTIDQTPEKPNPVIIKKTIVIRDTISLEKTTE